MSSKKEGPCSEIEAKQRGKGLWRENEKQILKKILGPLKLVLD